MAKFNPTPEQSDAIDTRDRTLLVSAAAGSGKTATLTERIIRALLDEENQIDISDMLIVTFTRAAARELSDRIGKAIKDALSLDRDNERLKRQLVLLPSARICTIDSFCADVLKSNAERFGISPSYRIAERAEASLLALSLLNSQIDATYDGLLSKIATPREFEELCSCLCGVRGDESLAETFLSLHDKSKSALEGAKIFKKLSLVYKIDKDTPIEGTIYGKHAVEHARKLAKHYIKLLEALKSRMNADMPGECACISSIDQDILHLTQYTVLDSYEEMRERLTLKLPKKISVKKDDVTENTDLYAKARQIISKDLTSCYDKLFSLSREEWMDTCERSARLTEILASFIEYFDAAYFEEKRRMNMLEFSDVERLTYYLLCEDGKPTKIALALSDEFRAIYIDEYQDVSPIQDAIFKAISKDDNRFMVGDVKQSIYSFRSARPSIFVDMKNSFPALDKDSYSSAASIFMSTNFRCDEQIIDFVNQIFDIMFGITADSIGYVDADRLSFGKGSSGTYEPSIHLFVSSDEHDDTDTHGDGGDEPEHDESEPDDSLNSPVFVAEEIKRLLDFGTLNSGNPITPSSIAILFRHNDAMKKYVDVLTEAGIPCESTDSKEFFLNPDVLLMLCLLNSIDNPRRDIYLAGLMCSPLFSFTADELYRVRNTYKKENLYSSLMEYSKNNPCDEKCNRFIKTLSGYRALAEGVSVDALISKLYAETGILYLAEKNGKKHNLMLLYNYAVKYEANGYKGLYSFINYINKIIDNNEKFESAELSSAGDAVKIASVHSSKGLEYPIVFIVETQRTVGSIEKRERISYSEDFGIAFKLREEGGLALINNPIKNSILLYNEQKSFEEELRVLYVALTRARERLYIVGRATESEKSYLEKVTLSRLAITPYSSTKLPSFLRVVLACAKDTQVHIHKEGTVEKAHTPQAIAKKADTATADGYGDTVNERFSFVYPYPHHSRLPEKLSISHLYPTVLDDDVQDDLPSIDKQPSAELKRGVLPRFITGKKEDESARKGIATHTYLQFCDLEHLARAGAKEELDRLLKHGFLSKENADRVRLDEIELFVNSNLFRAMRSARALHRELRFNCSFPASLFTSEGDKAAALAGEEILLQGVIDCIIENEDGSLCLVDYKTDRLTREELANRALAEKKLREAHSLQLTYYKMALEKIYGKSPSSVEIYSLPLGDTVKII